jgi:pSer/pThr/pTyr-binding forkhead associated (FHA) protein
MSRARLILITDTGEVTQEFEINQPTTVIGRSPQSNVVIEHSDISRAHAEIITTPNGFFVTDMGSTNGTFLNGAAIKAKQMFELRSNDQVNLGKISLMFQLVPDSFPQPTPQSELDYTAENNFSDSSYQPSQTAQQNLQQDLEDNSQNSNYYQSTAQNYNPHEFVNQHPYANQSEINIAPTYLPPSPAFQSNNTATQFIPENLHESLMSGSMSGGTSFTNLKPSFNDEELRLAGEIFGESKAPSKKEAVKWSGNWQGPNLFQKPQQIARNKANSQTSEMGNELVEDELFKQVFGNSNSSFSPGNTFDNPLNLPSPINQNTAFNSPEAHKDPTEIFNQAEQNQNTAQLANLQLENDPQNNQSYYYPSATGSSPNIFPKENYSYSNNNSSQEEDPFKALKYSENDSIFAKFQNPESNNLSMNELKEKLKRETHHEASKTNWSTILKNYALPIGILVIAVIIVGVVYIRKSGLFG